MDGNGTASSLQQSKGDKSSNPQRQHSHTSGSDDEEEEESEESRLSNFRKQWEDELRQGSLGHKTNTPTTQLTAALATVTLSNTPTQFSTMSPGNLNSGSPRCLSSSDTPIPSTSTVVSGVDRIEEEAKKFFLMGVSFERRGDLYDAVRFYRRAMQLVPDIERRLQAELREEESAIRSNDQVDETDQNLEGDESDDQDVDDDRPLYTQFIQRIEANRWQFFQKFRDEDGKRHISDFPIEIMLYILRWVVSSDLDVRSLDSLGSVCRGFYCLSRDEKLWKMACDRVWTSCEIFGSEYSTYREMFLTRPRVRFDGCYISRITYVRPGEHSFQDASYRPWHTVEYFRYLRFFPDGKVYFLTTAEKPALTVGTLKDAGTCRNGSILKGTYRLYGNNVISASARKSVPPHQIQTRPGKTGKKPQPQETTEFNMDFEIQELKGKSNWALCWTYYAVSINSSTLRNNNRNNNGNGERGGGGGGGITSTFELNPNKYPPLYFSRVKSYTLNSESILE